MHRPTLTALLPLILPIAGFAIHRPDPTAPAKPVEIAPVQLAPERPNEAAQDPRMILLKAVQFDPLVAEPEPSPGHFWRADAEPSAGTGKYLVQFNGVLQAQWQQSLRDLGANILNYVPNNALLVELDVARLPEVRALPGVRWVGHYRNWYKIDPRLINDVVTGRHTAKGVGRGFPVEITGYRPGDGAAIRKFAGRRFPNARVQTVPGTSVRVHVPPAQLADFMAVFAADENVHWVAEKFENRPHNNHSPWYGQTFLTANSFGPDEGVANYAGANNQDSVSFWAHGLLGQNQILGNADSGLDASACYFRSTSGGAVVNRQTVAAPGALTLSGSERKILAYNILPNPLGYNGDGDHSTCSFHGTHTVGSMIGDNFANVATGGPANFGHDSGDGNAPMAKVVFQDIGVEATSSADCTDPLDPAPCCLLAAIPDIRDLGQQAYDAGVRIHNNSWGATDNTYSANAVEVDEFMWNHPDFLFFFSAGNDDGKYNSVSSPSTNKNGLSVAAMHGASLISETTGAADTDNRVATFSNGGPVADGRRKPDLGAPGGTVISALGTTSMTDANCGTVSMSGTSMSSPTAAGYGALLRQYFTEGWYPTGAAVPANAITPSASLLKATLIAGARMVTQNTQSQGDDAGSTLTWAPNARQGFGAILLNRSVSFSTGENAAFATYRTKVWDINRNQGVATGITQEYNVDVATGTTLSIVLDWTDPPGLLGAAVPLVNNLNLVVIGPTGTIYRGNQFTQPAGCTGSNVAETCHKVSTANAAGSDAINTTEMVYLASGLTAGNYRIQVTGANVPGYLGVTQQGYALAVVGDLTATTLPTCALAAPTGVTAVNSGANQITINWTATPGATRYGIYRNAGPGGTCANDFAQIAQVGNVTSYVDTTVNGGYTYNYKVAPIMACEGPLSATCGTAIASGNCILKPSFSGISAANGLSQSTCGVTVNWSAGSSNCPLSTGVKYNLYRGTTPDFTPGAGNRIATCLTGTSHTDTNGLTSGNGYYYVIRAEDASTLNGGPCNGGNEDLNISRKLATPYGVGIQATGSNWTDGAGDTTAKLSLNPPGVGGSTAPGVNNDGSTPWIVAGGALDPTAGNGSTYAYRNAGPIADRIYSPDTCAEISTPNLTPGATSTVLTYDEKHSIEYQWDMVTVEYSTNNGTSWTRVPDPAGAPTDWGLISQTMNPPINKCGYNNSTDRGWTGPAAATTPTTPPPAPTAYANRSHTINGLTNGGNLKVRWRMTTDPGAEFRGFYLDNIQITDIRQPNACTTGVPGPGEVSGAAFAMTVAKATNPNLVVLNFQELAGVTGYNVYEGNLPISAYTHGGAPGNVCAASTTSPSAGRRVTAAAGLGTAGSHYYLVTAYTTVEGPSGYDSSAVEINPAASTCAP